jgi:hypothetical protein
MISEYAKGKFSSSSLMKNRREASVRFDKARDFELLH